MAMRKRMTVAEKIAAGINRRSSGAAKGRKEDDKDISKGRKPSKLKAPKVSKGRKPGDGGSVFERVAAKRTRGT